MPAAKHSVAIVRFYSHAAIDVLPLAAVAFGLTAIGIVFLIEASLAR